MAEEQQMTATPPQEVGMTFGGSIPEVPQRVPESPNTPAITLEDPEPAFPALSLSSEGDPPPLRNDDIEKRKEKIAFAFGKDAPAPEVIEQYLMRGDEQGLRESLAQQKDTKNHEEKINLVKEEASKPVPNEQLLEALVRYKPQTASTDVIEKAFGDEYVKTLYGMKSPEENIATIAASEDPEHAAQTDDIARIIATKQEGIKTLKEEARSFYESSGTFSKILDFGAAMLPGNAVLQNYRIGEVLPNLGVKSWDEAVLYIMSLSSDEMIKQGRAVIQELAKHNPTLAMAFADNLGNMDNMDRLIQNVATIADVGIAIKAPTTLVKMGAAGVKGAAERGAIASSRDELVTALKDHLKSNGHDDASVAGILSRGGDLDQSATAAVVSKAQEILAGKVDLSMTRREIKEILPSVFNPEAILADGSNFGGQKTLELMSHMIENSSKVLNAVNESIKVGRLPEEALQVAIKEAQEALKTRFKAVDSTVVDMHHNPHQEPFDEAVQLHPHQVLSQYADDLVDVEGSTIESLRQGTKYAPEAPQPWHTEVNQVAKELSQSLNLTYQPKLWFGDIKDGSYGLAFQSGHIVLSNKLNKQQAMTILGHELGHHHQWILFNNAEPEVRTAIVKEWMAHRRSLRDVPNLTEADIMHFVGDPDMPAQMNTPWARYGNSFREWYAEQVSKFLTTNAVPVSMQEKFFQGIADMWKNIYAKITGLKPIGKEVEAFIHKNWKGDPLKRVNPESKAGAPVEFITTRPEQTQTGVGSVTALLGNREGSSFNNREQAFNWAKNIYKIQPGSFEIRQKGVGYYIAVTKDLDETTPGVRDALITTQNKTPTHLSYVLGWLGSGNAKVSTFQQQQRIAAVSGQQNLVAALKDLGKDISSLSGKEKKNLERVMRDNHLTVRDQETGATGIFHRTEKEFIDNYQRLIGKPPSAKETRAYFAAVQINDLEYLMRNNSYYKELSRLGLEKFSLRTKIKDPKTGVEAFGKSEKFYGKLIDDLPLGQADSKHPGMVGIYEEGKDPRVLDLNKVDRKELEDLKNQGFKIIQTGVPNRKPAGEIFGEEPINFIITKDHESHALEKIQLDYNPGWHQEYPHNFFVKQPIVRRVLRDDGTISHHVYEGDTTAMGFHTQAEATKYAQNFNEARKLLKQGDMGALKKFLDNNLPYTVREFRDLFERKIPGTEKTRYNIDDDFFSVSKGTSIVDVHGQKLSSSYTDFNDTLRSPWNLYNQVDKKFVGQRDPLLATVKEKGTEANPVFQLEAAETINPIDSLQRGMQNMIRNQYMLDYRTQAVESWIQEFKHVINADEAEVRADPLKFLYNDHFVAARIENQADVTRAKLAQSAIKEFLGNSMSDVTGVDVYKHKLLDSIYNVLGQKYSDWAAPKILSSETNPIKLMRGFAFHTNIGLFNPFHMWQNAMVMGNAIAIAGPRNGLEGAKAGIAFHWLRLNDSDAAVANLAKAMGWSKEDLTEAWKSFKKSGRLYIEGEHSWKDDLADPTFFQGKFGSFLDKGQIFFKEGERTARMVAYATAYREWRAANPGVKITADIERAILKRSDDMTVNMTRASSASWQQGLFAVPTQFWSYNARLTEQMLSGLLFNKGSLNRAEASRLLAFNSLMYGLPAGAASLVGAAYDPYQDVREYVQKNYGWGLNDSVITALHDGLLGFMTSMVTGRPNTISSRTGPSGNTAIQDIISGDKSFMEVATGVSGTKAFNALTSSMPLLKGLIGAATADPEKNTFLVSDMTDILKNVQSFSMATKLYLALTTGKQMSKTGRYEGDINPTEALFQFVTKGEPWDISDARLLTTMTKERKEAIKEISKQVTKEHSEALTALNNGDEKTYEIHMRRIESLFTGADMSADEKAAALKQTWDENKSLVDKIPYEWAHKNAPASKRENLQEQLRQSTGSPP